MTLYRKEWLDYSKYADVFSTISSKNSSKSIHFILRNSSIYFFTASTEHSFRLTFAIMSGTWSKHISLKTFLQNSFKIKSFTISRHGVRLYSRIFDKMRLKTFLLIFPKNIYRFFEEFQKKFFRRSLKKFL